MSILCENSGRLTVVRSLCINKILVMAVMVALATQKVVPPLHASLFLLSMMMMIVQFVGTRTATDYDTWYCMTCRWSQMGSPMNVDDVDI